MISKKIHYCWFGMKPIPNSTYKCIESWKKYCPEYEIIEWNEKNFDVYQNRYIRKAYEEGKYAFVSDYARFKILYDNGGIYLDTDVEIIKNLDDLLDKQFMAFEDEKNVNPGLGFAAKKGDELIKEIIDFYDSLEEFTTKDTVVDITTKILANYGLKQDGTLQNVKNFIIFPEEYFNPLGSSFGKLKITNNTYSIHNFDATWKNVEERKLQLYRKKYGRKLGKIFFILFHPLYALKIHRRKGKKCH